MDKIEAFKFRNPDALVQAIGARIRLQRLAMGMTQQELSERSGVSLSTLKLMEQQGKGSLQRLAKVAVVLGLDADLRHLFSSQRTYQSLEAVERTKRLRAPRRQVRSGLAARVSKQLGDLDNDKSVRKAQGERRPRR